MGLTKQVWIGLVEVIPSPNDKTFQGDKGAYVNVLAWVASASEYRTQVKQAADQCDMDVEKISDVEPFAKRLQAYRVHKSLIRLAEQVKKKQCVRFNTFYTYPSK